MCDVSCPLGIQCVNYSCNVVSAVVVCMQLCMYMYRVGQKVNYTPKAQNDALLEPFISNKLIKRNH